MGNLRVLRGQMFKSMGKITAGPIGTKFGTHIGPTDGSGNGHKLKNIGPI